MALSNLENLTIAQSLAGTKDKIIQNYFQPALGLGIINFGPGFRVWQHYYDAMILDLMSKAVAADAIALSYLELLLNRVFIKNSDAVTRTFTVDGLDRSLASGADWCLHITVADLIQQQAARLGYSITNTTAADYATNGVVETFGD